MNKADPRPRSNCTGPMSAREVIGNCLHVVSNRRPKDRGNLVRQARFVAFHCARPRQACFKFEWNGQTTPRGTGVETNAGPWSTEGATKRTVAVTFQTKLKRRRESGAARQGCMGVGGTGDGKRVVLTRGYPNTAPSKYGMSEPGSCGVCDQGLNSLLIHQHPSRSQQQSSSSRRRGGKEKG